MFVLHLLALSAALSALLTFVRGMGEPDGTKACVIADSSGRSNLCPNTRQVHELPMAPKLLARLAQIPKSVVADRGYISAALREHIWNFGARPVILTQHHKASAACRFWIYYTDQECRFSMG